MNSLRADLKTCRRWEKRPALSLALLGVLSLACSTHDEAPRIQHANAPLRNASASSAESSARATPGLAAAAPKPSAHFELVNAGECRDDYWIEDLGTRTLLVSPHDVRFVEAGQPWAAANDSSAGLPGGRGPSSVFAHEPLILRVALRPVPAEAFNSEPDDDAYFRYVEGRWVPLDVEFGALPIALPLQGGTAVVGWFDERAQHRGDLDSVPAGNLTRAQFIAADGKVSLLPNWPLAMSWQQQSSLHALWAICARPNRSGHYLLRVPFDGAPSLQAIPGLQRCRGESRLQTLAALDSVTDDAAELTVWDAPECIDGKLAGHYRYTKGHFERTGEAEPPAGGTYDPRAGSTVTANLALFTLEGNVVTVTRGEAVERLSLPELPPSSEPVYGRLEVTAGGHEVWVRSRRASRCYTHRYQSPASEGF
ncbi:MAG TPA: hypothetical protein VHM70_10050 [Polyangiaceae bacterium]|nr:hypothetical protein [Polyangiaceae bacterium]